MQICSIPASSAIKAVRKVSDMQNEIEIVRSQACVEKVQAKNTPRKKQAYTKTTMQQEQQWLKNGN